MGYGSQEYASGYGPAPGSGYPPPPSSSDYSAYGAAFGAAAAADYGAGYGAYPPPPGYGYPGYPPGYGAGYFDGFAYGPPPPGYPGYPPPPGAFPPPPDMPAIGYGPTDSHSSSRGREGGRDRDGGRRGGRDEGSNFKKRRGGGGGGGKDKNKDGGGYGKADQDNRRNNRSEPYGGGGGGRGGRGGGRGGGGGNDRDRDSHAEPVPANNLYVTGLPGEFDEDKLKDVFAPHGKVAQCKVLPPRPGETKTVALVRFDTADEAKKVKEKVNGQTLEGMDAPITVRYAENKGGRDDAGGRYAGSNVVRVTAPGIDGIVSTFESVGPLKATRGHEHHKGQLYVAGLPPDTSNVHLYRLFAPFGSIGPKGVHAMMTPDGKCKGIAFVNFLEEESAQLAIATYNGAVLPDGTAMKVSMKMPKNAA